MRLRVERLESREVPTVIFTGNGTLTIKETGSGVHSVAVTTDGVTLTIAEQTNSNAAIVNQVPLNFVDYISVHGTQAGRNTTFNDTAVTMDITGGPFADVIKGGTGFTSVHPGGGNDTIFVANGPAFVDARNGGMDNIIASGNFTNTILSDNQDRVAVAPTTEGVSYDAISHTIFVVAGNTGSTTNIFNDLGGQQIVQYSGLGPDGVPDGDDVFGSMFLTGAKYVVFIGGNGNDNYTNYTNLSDVASGAAGDDVLSGGGSLAGGYGKASLLLGGAGDDTLIGHSAANVLDGGIGVNQLTLEGSVAALYQDLVRAGSADTLTGLSKHDIWIRMY